ncbi:MAG: hypothetical protein IT353_07895 [Gemmatimonadaceae bacterium]|nr:hypothetical protein [Gemmatimonadaceae bacterium]
MRQYLVALVATILLTSCNAEPGADGQICTLIGCADGLVVDVGTPPLGPWTIEATPAGQPARTFACAAGSQCSFVRFEGIMQTPITFKVTVGAQMRTEVLSPVTTTSRPNGPKCDPECRTQRVTLSVP